MLVGGASSTVVVVAGVVVLVVVDVDVVVDVVVVVVDVLGTVVLGAQRSGCLSQSHASTVAGMTMAPAIMITAATKSFFIFIKSLKSKSGGRNFESQFFALGFMYHNLGHTILM